MAFKPVEKHLRKMVRKILTLNLPKDVEGRHFLTQVYPSYLHLASIM